MSDQGCHCQSAPKALIGPSVLNFDLSNLFGECLGLLKSGADYLHLDVMDGQFVDDITFGHPVVKCLRQNLAEHAEHADAFFDMHMMVARPEKYVTKMADAGASQYTFHYEATDDVAGCIRKVKESGMKCGLGIKPGTPVEAILPFVADLDMALVMTVEPGKGGQKFMAEMLPKVRLLRERFPLVNIQVDGGVGLANVDVCAEHGVNMIVAGTSLLRSSDRAGDIARMKETISAKLGAFKPAAI